MIGRSWFVAFSPVLLFLALGPPAGAAEDKAEKEPAAVNVPVSETDGPRRPPVLTEPVVFDMEEIPAFGEQEATGSVPVRMRYPQGQYAPCQRVPSGEVKTYPELKSPRPLYGSVTFDAHYYDARPGITYYFVLDESGEAEGTESAKTAKKTDGTAAPKTSLLQSLAKALMPERPAPSAPQFVQPKCTYDRLYFDLNGDRDLTNDGVIQAAEKSILAALPNFREPPSTRYFNELAVSFDFGEGVGNRPFILVPRVQGAGQGFAMMQFIAKTARKGTIRLGGQEYVVWLLQSGTVSGRYDRSSVQLEVSAADPSSKVPPLLRSGPLAQMQVVDGQYLSLSASPLGDKLSIVPYGGDLGVLEVGPGGRPITDFGVVGQLVGRSAMVPLGQSSFPVPESLLRRYEVPVGDYMLPSLTAQYGRIRFSARMMPAGGPATERSFPVQIRKEKPYILEFSGKPEVKFVNPRDNQTFRPGATVYISAMLTEPFQGVQITGLWDATKKESTVRVVDGGTGTVVTVPQYAQLNPTIVIRNSAGKEVATGTMPFG